MHHKAHIWYFLISASRHQTAFQSPFLNWLINMNLYVSGILQYMWQISEQICSTEFSLLEMNNATFPLTSCSYTVHILIALSYHFFLIASLQVSSVMETVWPFNIMAFCSVTPCSLASHPRRAWEPHISCLASCLCSMSPLHKEEIADQYIWKHRRKNSWYMSFWVLAKSHTMCLLIILLSEKTMLMDELECHRTCYRYTLCPCMP